MLVYVTESGTTYLVDEEGSRICRASGDDTENRIKNEWKKYLELRGGEPGTSLWIIWGFGEDENSALPQTKQVALDDDPDRVKMRTTRTSRIISRTLLEPN